MADLKTIKQKKIRTNTTSTLSKLSHKKQNNLDPEQSITNRKSRSVANRSYSYEKTYPGDIAENEKNNLRSSKTMQTENKPEMNENKRCVSNLSLGSASPSKRQSQIPVLSRNSPKPGASRKKSASTNMISPKTVIISTGKMGQSRRVKNPKSNRSRSPSPLPANRKQNTKPVKTNGRSRSSCTRNLINNKARRIAINERCVLQKKSLQKKTSSASNVNCNKSYTTITLCSPRADSDAPVTEILTPESQGNESSYTNEDPTDLKGVSASTTISKISLDYGYDIEPCNDAQCMQPHCNSEYSKLCDLSNINENDPQLELLDLSLKDSESQLFRTVPGSAVSSARKSLSNDSFGLDALQTPKTTVRTISGDELVFSSSMELDIENDLKLNVLQTENDETIKKLLTETEDDSFVKAYAGIRLIEDDANEYDSEGATDVDLVSSSKHVKSEEDFTNERASPSKSQKSENGKAKSLESKESWRGRENELLTDVSYRQFLYHPAILRRKTRDGYREERPRSKSIEYRNSFRLSDSEREKSGRCKRRSFKKRDTLQAFVSNRDVNITPLRTWSDKTPQEEERQIYDRLHSEYVLKEIKRERTKKERVTGAVLRITAKFIYLLAILNLWPGDNCQLLTSHTLRYGR